MSATISGKQNPERTRYFVELYTKWRTSELTQAEFCRNEGVNINTFNCWKLAIERNSVNVDEVSGGKERIRRTPGKKSRGGPKAKAGTSKSDALEFRPVRVKDTEGGEPKSTRAEKRHFWERMVRRHCESGLPTEEFCQRHRINRNTLFYWKSRLVREHQADCPALESADTETIDPAERGDVASSPVASSSSGPKIVAELLHERSATTLRIFAEAPAETISTILQAFLAR